MLQLKNETPFSTALDCLYDVDGVEILIVTIKALFTFAPSVRIAEQQLDLVKADEYWGEADASSIKQGMEVTLIKPKTDIIMTGNAFAPAGKKVRELDVHLTIGEINKTVRVFGDRVWMSDVFGLTPSEPEPFEMMPLVYERAYGGVHELESKTLGEPSNPVGQGFKGKRGKKELEGQPLPNLEDPNNLITIVDDTPSPVGFSWIAPHWEPRKQYVGTYDQAWERNRAPYLPEDFNPFYFQAAPSDLVSPERLTGGEMVTITNMSPDGDIQFSLPTIAFEVNADFGKETEPLDMTLATVHLKPNEQQFAMIWQGAVNGDKRVLQCQELTIKIKELLFYNP